MQKAHEREHCVGANALLQLGGDGLSTVGTNSVNRIIGVFELDFGILNDDCIFVNRRICAC